MFSGFVAHMEEHSQSCSDINLIERCIMKIELFLRVLTGKPQYCLSSAKHAHINEMLPTGHGGELLCVCVGRGGFR